MQVREHAGTSLEFLEKADRHFADGDDLQGSEKLWGAAAHALMSVAQEKGWPYKSHPSLRDAAKRLSEELNDTAILSGFGVAESFHRNFYHRYMEESEWHLYQPVVQDFVARVLALREEGSREGQV